MKAIGLALLGIVVLVLAGVGGLAAAAFATKAPACPAATGSARSLGEINRVLSEAKSITISDAEGTAIGRGYLPSPSPLNNVRVCFTSGRGHLSGEVPLGPFTPSFYASGGVDLTGSRPRVTNLEIQVGAIPNLPVVSDTAKNAIADLINQQLGRIDLKTRYAVEFRAGSAAVRELSP